MKKKLVRLTAAFMAAVMSCGMLASCGEKKSAEGERMTIDWLMYCDGPMDENSPVELYIEEMFDVDLNVWYIERSKWDELLNIRIATGEVPDVFVSTSSKAFYNYVNQNVLAEVSEEKIREKAPALAAAVDGYDPDSWKFSKVDGVNYAVPLYNYNNRFHIASVWRDDWLKNVGINKIPETIEEFEEAFYKFRNEDPDGNGVKDTYGLSDKGIFNSIFGAFGFLPRDMTTTNAMWREKDGELVYAGIQPEMKEALGLLAKWYADGIIDPEFLTGENTGGHWSNSQAFLNGRIGYTANGMYYHVIEPQGPEDKGSTFYRDFKSIAGEDATYAIGKPPKGSGDVYGNFGGGALQMGGIVFGKQLEKDEAKLDKILEIINTVNTTKDLYNISVYGFEGEHWDKSESGAIISREGFSSSAERAKIGAANIFSIGGIYPIEWRTEGVDELTKKKYAWADKNTNYAKIENNLIVDLEEMTKYSSLLDKQREEVYVEIITGEKPLDYFDTFVEEFLANGGQEMIDAANEWYRTFK